MGIWRVTAIVSAVGTSLGGCAATTTTSKVAVDYNRAFAKSRDEVLVTNILRASAREPLQFSAMGTVTGGVRNTGSIKLPIPSLIGAGPTILSPEFTMNEGINPNINIIPLSNKEFTEGILKPVSLETVSFFLNQGWDPEFILSLVIGGIVCPNGGNLVLNRGNPGPHYEAFARMFAGVSRVPIRTKGKPQSIATIRLPGKEALAFMKDGVGKGQKIDGVNPVLDDKGRRTGEVELTIVTTPGLELAGLDTSNVCAGSTGPDVAEAIAGSPLVASIAAMREKGGAPVEQGKALLRSPEAIIYFLGETHRRRWPSAISCAQTDAPPMWPYYNRVRDGEPQQHALFQLDKSCTRDAVPLGTFMHTRFNDGNYFIRRAGSAASNDRTLSTLSFLNELIALQTSESSVTSATPVIAIGAR